MRTTNLASRLQVWLYKGSRRRLLPGLVVDQIEKPMPGLVMTNLARDHQQVTRQAPPTLAVVINKPRDHSYEQRAYHCIASDASQHQARQQPNLSTPFIGEPLEIQ